MGWYVKRPVRVEAERWHIDAPRALSPAFARVVCDCQETKCQTWHVHTLEGPHPLTDMDMIVHGTQGEWYPVKARVFEDCYDCVKGT